jgi:hypothetical protein
MPDLNETLTEVRRRIRRVGPRRMNEENTRATLMEPVLCALRWDRVAFQVAPRSGGGTVPRPLRT